MTSVKTIDLKGKAYATVPARLKQFREDCSNGLIETLPTIMPDGQILFKARILKDKSDLCSGEAVGHSLGTNKSEKSFEKLETIAIGRALAILGYMASGEIASSEEMEEFEEYKETQRLEEIEEAKSKLDEAKTLKALKDVFLSLNAKKYPEIIAYKDTLKVKYENK